MRKIYLKFFSAFNVLKLSRWIKIDTLASHKGQITTGTSAENMVDIRDGTCTTFLKVLESGHFNSVPGKRWLVG